MQQKMTSVSVEAQFAQKLAANEPVIRNRAVKKIRKSLLLLLLDERQAPCPGGTGGEHISLYHVFPIQTVLHDLHPVVPADIWPGVVRDRLVEGGQVHDVNQEVPQVHLQVRVSD